MEEQGGAICQIVEVWRRTGFSSVSVIEASINTISAKTKAEVSWI